MKEMGDLEVDGHPLQNLQKAQACGQLPVLGSGSRLVIFELETRFAEARASGPGLTATRGRCRSPRRSVG